MEYHKTPETQSLRRNAEFPIAYSTVLLTWVTKSWEKGIQDNFSCAGAQTIFKYFYIWWSSVHSFINLVVNNIINLYKALLLVQQQDNLNVYY